MPRYVDANLIKLVGLPFEDVNHNVYFSLSDIRRAIEQTPTADVEEILHAEWFPHKVGGNPLWECSNCKTLGSPQWKRCPLCEAKMGGNGGKNDEL